MVALVNDMELDTITEADINQEVAALNLSIKKAMDIHAPLTATCTRVYQTTMVK